MKKCVFLLAAALVANAATVFSQDEAIIDESSDMSSAQTMSAAASASMTQNGSGSGGLLAASGRTVVSAGPHHRVWQGVTSRTNSAGRVSYSTNRVVELATGLNAQRNGQWQEASPEIKIRTDGTASAEDGAHQVYFAPNIAAPAPIQIATPDGQTIKMRPMGLAYYDFKQKKSVLIAEIKPTVGVLKSKNRIVYPDAFTDCTIDAVYVNNKAGLEQFLIIKKQLPLPEDFGLNSKNCWLEAWTECIEGPEPTLKQEVRKGWKKSLVDRTISFGKMHIGEGLAFTLGGGDDKLKEIPVNKHWIKAGGRTFLVEEVSYLLAAPELRKLGRREQAAIQKKGNIGIVSKERLFPARRLAQVKAGEKIQLGSLDVSPSGFAIDWNLGSSYGDLVLETGVTYYLSGSVLVLGNLTIEGGAVIKCTNDTGIAAYNVTCKTDAYRPATFTAYNDNSVGQSVTTGRPPELQPCTGIMLDLYRSADLRHLHFRWAKWGVRNYCNDYAITHCQFIHCDGALWCRMNNCYVRNVLMSDVGLGFAGAYYHGHVEHLTFDQGSLVQEMTDTGSCEGFGCTLDLKNSIIICTNKFSVVSVTAGPDVAFLNSSDGVFATAVGGEHYLPSDSHYRNVGTTNINPSLAADLQTRTTRVPLILDSDFTVDTTLSARGICDTDANPDLGYHYATIDYCIGNVNVTGVTLLVTNSAAIGLYSTNDIPASICIGKGGAFISGGDPLNFPKMFWCSDVQESIVPGQMLLAMFGMMDYASPCSATVNCRFTQFSSTCVGFVDVGDIGWVGSITLRDCQFYGGANTFQPFYYSGYLSVGITNCMFYNTAIGCEAYTAEIGVAARNNLFYKGDVALARASDLQESTTFDFKDNLFVSNSISQSGDFTLIQGYNAYATNCDRLSPNGLGDVILTNISFETGPLGDFYLPADSLLIDAGSRIAPLATLYHYTTTTNQVKEAISQVDIGFHYVAVSVDGLPLDSDGDGIPDYVADANGNGIVDPGEPGWRLDLNVWITRPSANSNLP